MQVSEAIEQQLVPDASEPVAAREIDQATTTLADALQVQGVQQAKRKAAETAKAAAEEAAAKKETKGQKAVAVAKKQIGVPYVYAGASPSGFDCSGLTSYAYGKVGVTLTHNAQAQFNECKSVSLDSLEAGDLVFFGSGTGGISHVGMYVGDGMYIHAPRPGAYVRIDTLADRTDCVGACRPY